MKTWHRWTFALLACVIAIVVSLPEAEARRLGGGRSFGKQTDIFRKAPARAPANAGGAAQRQGAAAAGGGSRWLGPIGGLAAGLGLAALASHLGLGEEFGSILLIGLVIMAVMFVLRRMGSMARQPAVQGAGQTLRQSARPELLRHPMAAPGGQAPDAAPGWDVPADFDSDGFLRQAKVQFIRLQAVFDARDLNDLREFTTPEVFAELKVQIEEDSDRAQRTEVVRLDAELLGIETGPVEYLASVRFSGLIREAPESPPIDFAEVWNLSKPANGAGGWVLAGIQQAS